MFILQTTEEQNLIMKRTTVDSEDIRLTKDPASLGNTELPSPFSWLFSKCSQQHKYGSGWSQLVDPPPHSCDEASSAYLTECISCKETRDQISLQGHRLDTPAAEKRDKEKKNHSHRPKTLDSRWAWVVLLAAIYITVSGLETNIEYIVYGNL